MKLLSLMIVSQEHEPILSVVMVSVSQVKISRIVQQIVIVITFVVICVNEVVQ